MTNTYKDNTPINEKAKEELRLIRCLMERLLRCMNESLFVDYQMEKFGDKFKGDTHSQQPDLKGIASRNGGGEFTERFDSERKINSGSEDGGTDSTHPPADVKLEQSELDNTIDKKELKVDSIKDTSDEEQIKKEILKDYE